MDTRRTILWMIFSFSLLFLWNNWQVHNGSPSLFGGTPVQQESSGQATATPGAGSSEAGVPTADVPAAGVPAEGVPTTVDPGAVPATTQASSGQTTAEPVVITTDVLRLTFDPIGARIIKAELLRYDAVDDRNKPVVLLDNSPGLVYTAESGAV